MENDIKPWFQTVKNEGGSSDIMVYGNIGLGDGQIKSADFLNALTPLVRSQPLTKVKVNCYGGSVYEGLAMYNGMKMLAAETGNIIMTINEGVAASMGSVILQGASPGNRKALANTRIMTHRPSTIAIGSAEKLRDIANETDSLMDEMKAIYMSNSGQDETIVDSWMLEGKDRWFTSAEAFQCKLIDEIIPVNSEIKADWTLPIADIVALFTPEPNPKTDMDIKTIAAQLGCEPTEAAVTAALQNQANQAASLKAQLETQNKNIISADITAAIAAGKIEEGQRVQMQAIGEKLGVAEFKAMLDNIKPRVAVPSIASQVANAHQNNPAHTPSTIASLGIEGKSFLQIMKLPHGASILEKLERDHGQYFAELYSASFGAFPPLEPVMKSDFHTTH